MASIKIKNRNSNIVNEVNYDQTTSILYNTVIGRLLLKLLTMPFISNLAGMYLSSKYSKSLIAKFITKNSINMNDYLKEDYQTFNDFFSRRINPEARPIDLNPSSLISPCDAKLTVYKINDGAEFKIKDSYYGVKDLVNDIFLAEQYTNGYALIFRLGVDDYHRYSFIDNGMFDSIHSIKGVLHTVRPIALNHYNIYKQNSRDWTILHTENYGDVIHVEVGALLVGKIVNLSKKYSFIKGEEKGYFQYGGSTIVLLFKENTIDIDQDILINSSENIETIVKLGEKIGTKK